MATNPPGLVHSICVYEPLLYRYARRFLRNHERAQAFSKAVIENGIDELTQSESLGKEQLKNCTRKFFSDWIEKHRHSFLDHFKSVL